MKLDKEVIFSGVKKAKDNTWLNRYNIMTPNIEKTGSIIKYSTSSTSIEVNSFDEIILTILIKFLFMPVWLIYQCYENGGVSDKDETKEKIEEWIKIGIVWKEGSVTGEYLRPTYALFSLFGINPYSYTNIPFNTLTHTISEEKVVFDVMSGNSDILKREKIKIPRISELGFEPYPLGTNIIAEEDFRNPILFTENGLKELIRVEDEINDGILTKKAITPELENFRFFNIVKKIGKGNKKEDFVFHVPDLCIPLPRKEGLPQSVAIEVELTDKRGGYTETLARYKNNNRFGVVYWLVGSASIAQSLKTSFIEVGGTGNTRMVLQEFIIPSPNF